MQGGIRKKWRNYVGNQSADPLFYFRPGTLSDLVAVIKDACAKGHKVKAVGAGHSSSDIALTDDYMIDMQGLNKVLDTGLLDLRADTQDPANLFFVEGGIRLNALNKILDQKGKALINMGAYTGQTIAGVISTSTHGSGIGLGAFPSFVTTIFLIDENGDAHQIERAGGHGISIGPTRLEGCASVNLILDDQHFNAAAVAIGCMGVIYAVVIRVMESYRLKETRRFSTWHEVKIELANKDVLSKNRHFEVLVNPYAYSGTDHKCMVTQRNINDTAPTSLIPRGHRKWYLEVLLLLIPNFIIDAFMLLIINHFPKLIPTLIQIMMAALTDRDYIDKSFKVLDLGRANNLAAYATEIALPEDKFLVAVDAIVDLLKIEARENAQYLTAPFSLRFIKANPFYLSMQYSREETHYVCMIEFISVNGSIGGKEILSRIESAMKAFEGKPHWGQVNHAGGVGEESLSELYPEFEKWLQVYRLYSPKGRFQNDFTRRCGIEAEP